VTAAVTSVQQTAGGRATAGAPPLLAVEGVDVLYDGAVLALRGASLAVPDGRVVALLGSNGAGKSTLLKAVSGLLPTERGQVVKGTVRLRGEDITAVDGARRVGMGLSLSMEGRHVFPHMTVQENLIAGAHSRGGAKADDFELVYNYLPRLSELRGRTAGYLSGGEQQMLAIGRALMARPALLMLDEPSLGLAPMLVEEIFGYVRQLNAELGTAVLVVEQNARRALAISDIAYVMEQGRVVLEGPADQVRDDPQVQALYLGVESGGERKNYKNVKHAKRRARWL
jgi:branched-chain amino acid transport system ATP-binding protein